MAWDTTKTTDSNLTASDWNNMATDQKARLKPVITSPTDNEVMAYDATSSEWINQTPAEAGLSAVGHPHAAGDTTSGTFADARIAQSNITQHQSAIDHDALVNYDIAKHRIINDSGTSTTELWSADKIHDEINSGGSLLVLDENGDLTLSETIAGLVEIDGSNDLMPSVMSSVTDNFFELDSNFDVMPQ